MPYLLGAIGVQCTPDQIKKLSRIAFQQAAEGAVQTVSLENGIIFAGYTCDETYHYNDIIPLPIGQGVLVGKLFDSVNYNPVVFSHEQIQVLINDPKNMSKLFWGRYVGVLYNKKTKTVTLIRDPQGLSTLFYVVKPDGIIFSTEIALLYTALDVKPTVDLHYFCQHIIHANNALAATPFEGIQELLPGMGMSINSSGEYSQELLWDISGMHGSFITDENGLEEELLARLRACTKAWVGDAQGVCVELSGGTDSSGVMLLLRDMLPVHKKLMAVNFIDSKIQSSNEIEYAQEVADVCNVPLHFLDWQTTSLLDKLPHDFRPNRPSTLLLFHNLRKQLYELARQNNCPVVMNGQGGDHVFFAPPPKHALADYWLDQGIRGIKTPLTELSGIYRMPWLSLVQDNAKAVARYYRKFCKTESSAMPYLDKNFVQELKLQNFYLNNMLKNFYPGKATHIESLCHAVAYAERSQSMPNICVTHPLLSQPIIELGLRIPTYQSFYDGYDRIFFRRAVSRLKKTKSLWRRIKGQTTGSMAKECASHAQEIRQIVLNGKIAASGMIDKQWVDQQILHIQHGQIENLWPMLHILTSQLWLNQWGL